MIHQEINGICSPGPVWNGARLDREKRGQAGQRERQTQLGGSGRLGVSGGQEPSQERASEAKQSEGPRARGGPMGCSRAKLPGGQDTRRPEGRKVDGPMCLHHRGDPSLRRTCGRRGMLWRGPEVPEESRLGSTSREGSVGWIPSGGTHEGIREVPWSAAQGAPHSGGDAGSIGGRCSFGSGVKRELAETAGMGPRKGLRARSQPPLSSEAGQGHVRGGLDRVDAIKVEAWQQGGDPGPLTPGRAPPCHTGASQGGSQRGRSDFLSAWGRGGFPASRHLAGLAGPPLRVRLG